MDEQTIAWVDADGAVYVHGGGVTGEPWELLPAGFAGVGIEEFDVSEDLFVVYTSGGSYYLVDYLGGDYDISSHAPPEEPEMSISSQGGDTTLAIEILGSSDPTDVLIGHNLHLGGGWVSVPGASRPHIQGQTICWEAEGQSLNINKNVFCQTLVGFDEGFEPSDAEEFPGGDCSGYGRPIVGWNGQFVLMSGFDCVGYNGYSILFLWDPFGSGVVNVLDILIEYDPLSGPIEEHPFFLAPMYGFGPDGIVYTRIPISGMASLVIRDLGGYW